MATQETNKDIHVLFNKMEMDVGILKNELEKKKQKKKMLQQQVLQHLSRISPNDCKRIFVEKPLLPPKEKLIEKMFSEMNISEEVLGYTVDNNELSYQETSDGLQKVWVIGGKVGDVSFIIEVVTLLNEVLVKEELFTVKKIELFPELEIFEEFVTHLKELNYVNTLVPSLRIFQSLLKERSAVEEFFELFIETRTRAENDTLFITVQLNSREIVIKWKVVYNKATCTFINNITVEASEEVLAEYKDHAQFSVLQGESALAHAEEVTNFIQALF